MNMPARCATTTLLVLAATSLAVDPAQAQDALAYPTRRPA
jgi:hypothetical protein